MENPGNTSSLVDWAVAAMTYPGQLTCGDLHLVAPFPDGVLLAAVDGLGHGDDAARAAGAAVATLASHAGERLEALFERCHAALRSTRGAAMSLASISRGLVSWFGVGNVEGLRLPGRNWMGRRGGVVGYHLPPLSPTSIELAAQDVLIFATDGIFESFADRLNPRLSPRALADQILTRHRKGTDDALVLVARYLGPRRSDFTDSA